MNEPRVSVITPGSHTDPLSRNFTIIPFVRHGYGEHVGVLDYGVGTVKTLSEGESAANMGILLPAEYALPLWESLGKALGKDEPTDTHVLREWLECERRRVDVALLRFPLEG